MENTETFFQPACRTDETDKYSQEQLLELYSSAYTLSDMEIFVFPELLFSLVLANIMSPQIWEWRKDPWFDNIRKMPPGKRVQRVKQYIMDHYTFNLDLETWGLTTQEDELDRFSDMVDPETIRGSNALFGYEGDRHYFSLDIRRHFGLDKYDSNIIPYWKTETVEAMTAFLHIPDRESGGGECVSLSTLYAAALFVVAGIPLEDIYLMATPLHSQNYLDIEDGILTNNRRIVTKTMLFNGSELSMKARRALENEQITIVANCGQYVHFLTEEAGIPEEQYKTFSDKLSAYLKMEFSPELFGNFLRSHPDYQKCFCYRHFQNKHDWYISAEKALRYEADSQLRVSDKSRKKLFSNIDQDEFYPEPLPGRIVVNDIEDFIRSGKLDIDLKSDRLKLHDKFCEQCPHTCDIVRALQDFIHIAPQLPGAASKTFVERPRLCPDNNAEREAILGLLREKRRESLTADLAFHAYREPGESLAPLLQAALRNPVCREENRERSPEEVLAVIDAIPEGSIYSGDRLALPDEVWNFQRGEALEKGIMAAVIFGERAPETRLVCRDSLVELTGCGLTWRQKSGKQIRDFVWESAHNRLTRP